MLGVAIAIPEPIAGELVVWRARVGDHRAASVPPHVTLVPPTPMPAEQREDVHRHLSDVAAGAQSFEMHLAGTGTFRPISQVVFVTVANGISHCELLEVDLRTGPLARDIEFPYHPHVTVAHDVPEPRLDEAYDGLSGFEARFLVEGFTAFEQDSDGAWRPVRHFPFGDGDAG